MHDLEASAGVVDDELESSARQSVQHGQPSPAETKGPGTAATPRQSRERPLGTVVGAHRRHLRTIPVETCLVKD